MGCMDLGTNFPAVLVTALYIADILDEQQKCSQSQVYVLQNTGERVFICSRTSSHTHL